MKKKSKWWRWIKLFLLIYSIIGIAFYYLQEKILLHPVKLPPRHQFDFDQSHEEYFLRMNNTDSVHITRFLSSSDTPAGAVIYFHGNLSNVERYARYTDFFTSRNYEVWMPDYPGFGKSTGEPDEKKILKMADEMMKLVRSRFGKDSIIIYGKSFGTGPASYLASYNSCKALVLETPYYSIPDLLQRYLFLYPVHSMSKYQMPVWKYLEENQSPVIILHGKKDGIISYKDAIRLRDKMKAGDRFVSIENGSHNDLPEFNEFGLALDSLLK